MNKPISTPPQWGRVTFAYRCDRWTAYYRLQELNIACSCAKDGTLCVELNHAKDLILAHSTIRQFINSRQDNIDWLERCWQTQTINQSILR
jgi:hypothetical protein